MSLQDDFESFWQSFPRKVGKLAAQREYARARKRVGAEALIAGITRYMDNKPAYADWCHPITFLRQGRWMDEAPEPERAAYYEPWLCPHEPRCPHRAACAIVAARTIVRES